jgi:Zn-dependent M28 family amino/carboxypeptidase
LFGLPSLLIASLIFVPAPHVAAASPDISVTNVKADLAQLQSIATANGGNRAHGRPGYLASVTFAQKAAIGAYLNFDLVASPNPGYFLYDGDNSDKTGSGPGPAGSAEIERTLATYFTSIGVPTRGTDFDGRSDYGPFIANGIPAGGIFTGAEGRKTAAQVQLWGGTQAAFDACYHRGVWRT